MKVMLFSPPNLVIVGSPESGSVLPLEDLGLGYLAAYLRRRGHEVRLVHCAMAGLTAQEAAQQVLDWQPGVVGISISFQSSELRGGMTLAQAIRQAGARPHIVAGGYTATFLAPYLLAECPAIDSICLGEGEQTLLELVNCLEEGREWRETLGLAYRQNAILHMNERRPAIQDLDALPFAARDVLPQQESLFHDALHSAGFALIETSRGCYGRCTYCSVPPFHKAPGRRWRVRSAARVVDEIEMLVADYAIMAFEIVDDNFLGYAGRGHARVREFARHLIERRLPVQFAVSGRADNIDEDVLALLRQAGMTCFYIGLESGSQSTLDRLRKGTTVAMNRRALEIVERLDVECNASFIMFDPWLTLEELRQTVDFIIDVEAYRFVQHYGNFCNTLTPFPGTPVREQIIGDPRLNASFRLYDSTGSVYTFYDFVDPRVKTIRAVVQLLHEQLHSRIQRLVRGAPRLLTRALPLLRIATPPADSVQARYEAWTAAMPRLVIQVLDELLQEMAAPGADNGRPPLPWKHWVDSRVEVFNREQLGMPFAAFLQMAQSSNDEVKESNSHDARN